MAATGSNETSVTERGSERLGKGDLRLVDVISQSIGFIGPAFSAAFFIPTIVGASVNGKGAGIASPVSIIVAMIGMAGIAWIISRYAARIHAAGSLYNYVTEAFGERVGFVGGWAYYGGMMALTLAIGLAFGGFLHDTLFFNHGFDLAWYWYSIAFWVVAFLMMFRGVAISTRVQLVLGLGSALVILGFSIWVIANGGSNGLSAEPFNPGSSSQGWNGIFFGVLYAVIMFIGFETSANLAEETANPKQNIPKAIFGSFLAVGVFYIIVTYAQAVGFGVSVDNWLANFPPLYALAADPQFGGSGFSELVQWIIVIDIAAVGLGTATGTSRGLFALARDGRLPRVLARVQETYKTPWVAALFMAVLAIVVIAVVALTNGFMAVGPMDPGEWFPLFNWGATFGGFMLIAVYLVIAIAGIRGMEGESRLWMAIAGVVGGAVSIGAIYGVIVQYADLPAYNRIWWIALIWIAVGILITLYLNTRGVFEKKTV